MNSRAPSPAMRPPSAREVVQHQIAEYLRRSPYWGDSPVIEQTRPLPRGGAVRVIIFGSPALRSKMTIWSLLRIEIAATGPLAYVVAGTYGSPDEALALLRGIAGEV